MPAYRLYLVDGAGRIASAEWLKAADDDEAVAQARAFTGGTRFELWQRDRLVARMAGKAEP